MKEKLKQQKQGSKKNFFYEIAGTTLQIPVTIIKGKQKGPTLLITAGIHGSEYPGIEAAKQLIKEIDPKTIAGNVIILPCVNQRAFYERASFINPNDGKNLNRSFPGKRCGTETERIAYMLENELFSLADFYLDFHSGDLPEALGAFVFIPNFGDKAVLQIARQGANQLDLPFGVISQCRTGAYNHACIIGTPSLLIERGGNGERSKAMIDGFISDAKRMMIHLGILQEQSIQENQLKLLKNVRYFDSPWTGLWTPLFKVGDTVKKGQRLGFVEDFFGELIGEYFAEQDGQILYQVVGLPITAGEHLISYGY